MIGTIGIRGSNVRSGMVGCEDEAVLGKKGENKERRPTHSLKLAVHFSIWGED